MTLLPSQTNNSRNFLQYRISFVNGHKTKTNPRSDNGLFSTPSERTATIASWEMPVDHPRATASSRRFRSWRRRTLAAALLATTIAIILTCAIPYLFFSPPPTLVSFHPSFNSSRDARQRVSLPAPLVSLPKPLSPPPARRSSDVKFAGNDHLKIRCSIVAVSGLVLLWLLVLLGFDCGCLIFY